MTIRSTSIVSIPVSDQQRANDSYVNMLGFRLRREIPFGEGATWIGSCRPAQ